jgi:uridylate kinase
VACAFVAAARPCLSISAGGSIMIPDAPDVAYIRQLASELLALSKTYRLFVVAGGGKLARNYIQAGRQLGADETTLDQIGIEATRLNARVLIAALGEHAYPRVPHDFEAAAEASMLNPIVVLGGTHPGHTTDAVAVMMGERARAARILILTNVDGVYTADPRVDRSAKRLDRLTASDLVALTARSTSEAGSTGVIDSMGSKIIQRARIPTCVLHGRDFDALRAAAEGRPFKGSLIVPG